MDLLPSVFGAAPSGDRLGAVRRSPQWDGRAFRNPLPVRMSTSPGTIWEFLTGGADARKPSAAVPIERRSRADFDGPQRLRLTWLGHGTTLVEIAGRRLLIDPVFSTHASPGPLFGVGRFHDPPLALADVPALDAVVLTHDHYDHLDAATVRALAGPVPRWVVPLGVGAHLERWGVPSARITEHDWWDETDVAGVRLVCTPSRHFSGRHLFDRNRTLWCGWAFFGDDARLYATGDGGYGPHFAEVGARLGPFDATLTESGAYNAAWADVHLGPEQAVQAVADARGGLVVPVHWGTFNLALHGWTEPVERVLVAADAAGLAVAVPKPGQPVDVAAPPPVERWWPDLAWESAEEAPVVSSGL